MNNCNHTGLYKARECHCNNMVIDGKYFICRNCNYTEKVIPPEDETMIDKLQDGKLMCTVCGSKRIYFESPTAPIIA
jgi:hypothetical protein